jgi:hypothetical protein
MKWPLSNRKINFPSLQDFYNINLHMVYKVDFCFKNHAWENKSNLKICFRKNDHSKKVNY